MDKVLKPLKDEFKNALSDFIGDLVDVERLLEIIDNYRCPYPPEHAAKAREAIDRLQRELHEARGDAVASNSMATTPEDAETEFYGVWSEGDGKPVCFFPVLDRAWKEAERLAMERVGAKIFVIKPVGAAVATVTVDRVSCEKKESDDSEY
jgi:hypothetical protein